MKKLLAALIGLGLGLGFLRLAVPAPAGGIYFDLSRMRAECDVLFVGPSYVNSQVYPDIVDVAAREAGHSLTSCKFAQMHLKGFEMKRELDIILSEPWKKLRLVLVDVTLGSDTWFKEENRFKRRVLRWHTLGFLSWFLKHLDGQREPLRERFLEHLQHVVVNALLVGEGAEHLAAMGKPEDRPKLFPSSKSVKPKQLDMKKLEKLNKTRVPRLIASRKRRGDIAPRVEWILELRTLVRSHGLAGDALIAPIWGGSAYPRKVLPAEDPPVIHAFNDPKKYPALYAVGSHKSDEHLTFEGSVEYSKLLGQLVAKRMKELE